MKQIIEDFHRADPSVDENDVRVSHQSDFDEVRFSTIVILDIVI